MADNVNTKVLTGGQAEDEIISFVKKLAQCVNAKGETRSFSDMEKKSMRLQHLATDPALEPGYYKLADILRKNLPGKNIAVHKAEGENCLALEITGDLTAPEDLSKRAMPLIRSYTVDTIQQLIQDFQNAVERDTDNPKKAKEQTEKLRFEISRSPGHGYGRS